MKVEPLGRTSQASTIAYLDSGVVFVGSSYGDSQLIRCAQGGGGHTPRALTVLQLSLCHRMFGSAAVSCGWSGQPGWCMCHAMQGTTRGW